MRAIVFVTDLVRDVMVMRAEEAEGGMEGLQREVIKLFLAGYDEINEGSKDGSDAAWTKDFIVRSLRHHVLHAQNPDVFLWEDELLMSVLTSKSNIICASAVRGIGLDEVKAVIDECERAGYWWQAAQLWWAAGTLRSQRAGAEMKRGWAAIKNLSEETEESLALESKILTLLVGVQKGACASFSVITGATGIMFSFGGRYLMIRITDLSLSCLSNRRIRDWKPGANSDDSSAWGISKVCGI